MGLLEGVLLASLAGAFAPAAAPRSDPPPYSLPWLLRPATPASVVRLDEAFAFFEDPASGEGGATYVTSLIATYRINSR